MKIDKLIINNSSTVIHCRTKREAEGLLKELEKLGGTWKTGNKLSNFNLWCVHNENTCYKINSEKKITFGNKKYFKNIVEFSELEF